MAESHELAVAPDHEMFEQFDLADEQQIIAEMSGRVTDKFVYTFKQNGQNVDGLSYSGTNWACREYAKQGEVIRIVDKAFTVDETNPEYVIVTVIAQRYAVNRETGKEVALDNTIGVKRQWRMMKKKKYDEGGREAGYEIVEDPFFWEKATSKAIRNAKQGLIPVDIVKELIKQALAKKNGQEIQPRTPQGKQQGRGAQTQKQQTQASTPPPSGGASETAPPPPSSATGSPQPQANPQTGPAAGPPPAPPAGSSSPPPAGGAAKPPRDVVNQKFEAALKAALQTQDSDKARETLKVLTGVAKISELPDDKLKTLGNLLNGVIKKANRVEGNKIVAVADNKVLWTGPEPAAAPPPSAAPAPQAEGSFEPF